MGRRWWFAAGLVVISLGALAACGDDDNGGKEIDVSGAATMTVASDVFAEGETIPVQYTCEGGNVSPPLRWTGAPAGTKAFALIVDDPDAPGGTFTHWVLYNLPATEASLAEGASPAGALPGGTTEGRNSFGKNGYGGPCPPRGSQPHRYLFKLYALDAPLNLEAGRSKNDVEVAMRGHVVAHGQVMGRFARK